MRDELILALELYFRSGRKQLPASDPEIVALSSLLNRLPLHAGKPRGTNFRNPNGVSMKLGNFLSSDPRYAGAGLPRGNQLEEVVWNEFANDLYRLRRTASAIKRTAVMRVAEPHDVYGGADEEEFPEGKILTRLHKERERSRSVVERKKKSVLSATGCLRCEVCDFDFVEFYGDVGRDFAECHHRLPVAELTHVSMTRLADLAIVCANCHRMLHRSRPVLTVEQLRQIVEGRRA